MLRFEEFTQLHEENQKCIFKDFSVDCKVTVKLFDALQILIKTYSVRFQLGIGDNRHMDIILSTLIKGMHNLEAVLRLTMDGSVGPARIIVRNIFEFLVMGKYILLHDDQVAREKWDQIEYINLDRRIFKNTVYPDNKNKEAFIDWWAHLCRYSHATRASVPQEQTKSA